MSTPIKVVIAEDHEITRVGLKVGIQRAGGVEIVAETDNGQDAINACISFSPNVVLMDIGLPIKNGIDATNEIKATCPDVKILMLTSHDNEEDIRNALGAGADGYCLKDIPQQTLVLAIQSIAAGAMWLDPRIAKSFLGFCRYSVESASAKRTAPASLSSSSPRVHLDTELTPRELEVLELVARGMSNSEIGQSLLVSPQTVKTHVRHIMEKMSVSDRTQAAVRAIKRGLV